MEEILEEAQTVEQMVMRLEEEEIPVGLREDSVEEMVVEELVEGILVAV